MHVSHPLSIARPSTNIRQNLAYARVTFNGSNGYLVRMFGVQDAAFFLESLLKMNPQDVNLISNVPGWPNAMMVSQPSVPNARPDALANNQHPLWILDFVPLDPLNVVPQQIWSPPHVSDWRRYVEQANLHMPVFFVQNNGVIGLPLSRAAVGDTALLHNAKRAAPLGGGHSAQIRIAASLSPSPSHVKLTRFSLPFPSSGLAMSLGNGRFRSGIKREAATKSRWNGTRSWSRA